MQTLGGIERIWQLTKAMEQAAAVGEWERAAQLVSERSPLIMSLSAPQSPAVLDVLDRVRVIDSQIDAAAKSAQSDLSAEYSAAMQATRQAGVYECVAHL
ncbi:flagellar protein FliT [Paraburkholderia sp. A1RO-5L]|uniref:flagellar protein FliT n=1 Tax=unclassified Paraburkholderia TaxID=2615204 RepID=UPI003B78FFB1